MKFLEKYLSKWKLRFQNRKRSIYWNYNIMQDTVQMLYSLGRGGPNVLDDTFSQRFKWPLSLTTFSIFALKKQQITFIDHVLKLGRFYRDKQLHFRQQYWLQQLHTKCTMETVYVILTNLYFPFLFKFFYLFLRK